MGEKEITRRTFITAAASSLLAGCIAASETNVTQVVITQTPTATMPTPTSTATATPTPTETATATPTTEPLRLADDPTTATEYRFPLVTRHAGLREATLFFDLFTAIGTVLLIWPEGREGEQRIVPLDPESRRHLVRIEGLEPGTRYVATVAAPDGDIYYPITFDQPPAIWEPITFRTLPEGGPIRVGVLGDTGFGDSITYQLVEQMAAADLDLILHTGDVVYRIYENTNAYTAWVQKWYRPFAPLLTTMPIYPIPGNHDYESAARWNNTHYYFEAIPPLTIGGRTDYHAFSLRDIQVLMLDSQKFFGVPGRQEQEAWLDERLADTSFAHTIPVYHVPAYSSGDHGDTDSFVVRSNWGAKFAEANVPLSLSGHDHNYERLIVGDTTYVVSGGGSATIYPLRETMEESIYFERRSHFVLLSITPEQIDLEAIAVGGEVIDSAAIPLG